MLTLFAILAASIAVPTWLAAGGNWRAAGLVLIGIGACVLLHAGVSIAAIVANDGTVPTWLDYYLLFATIPAGAVLLLAGAAVLCIRACVAWRRRRAS